MGIFSKVYDQYFIETYSGLFKSVASWGKYVPMATRCQSNVGNALSGPISAKNKDIWTT